jgi:signal transduction histidine kinase
VIVDGATIEHRLDVTGELVAALLASESTKIAAVLDDLATPIAVFTNITLHSANAAWHTLFRAHELPAAVIRWIAAVAATGATRHDDELLLEGSGAPAWVALTLRRDGDGSSVIALCAELTDAVIARQLAADPTALVWGGPRSGPADYFSARWRQFAASTDSTWERAIHPADLARCLRALDGVARGRKPVDVEARVRRGNGDYCWHRIRFAIVASARWYGSAIELEAPRRSEAEHVEALAEARAGRADAEHVSVMKDQFLAAVSHELRAPVTTILLWEKILRESAADGVHHVQAIDAIHQSALVQARLVDDLLDVSRAISGKLNVDLHPVDIEGVINGAIASIAPIALGKQIALERRGGPIGGLVLGDADRLRQILGNLLSNAVKFTEPLGQVSIAVTRDGETIAIAIADTGRGIHPDFVQRLFEPFSQTDDALTRGAGGLGLGLAIAKQLAVLHHGALTANSAGIGHGATFTLTLPCAARQRLTATRHAGRGPSLADVRVLVIDDDWRVREALALLLDRAGAIVETADSAAAARVMISKRAPQIVVSDIAMPGEDGYLFLQQLRATGCGVPAIALSAHATRTDIERARVAGYDLHLAKPVDFDKLVERIDELVGVVVTA